MARLVACSELFVVHCFDCSLGGAVDEQVEADGVRRCQEGVPVDGLVGTHGIQGQRRCDVTTTAGRVRSNSFYTMIAAVETVWCAGLWWVLVHGSMAGFWLLVSVALWGVMAVGVLIFWSALAQLWWWEVEEWRFNKIERQP